MKHHLFFHLFVGALFFSFGSLHVHAQGNTAYGTNALIHRTTGTLDSAFGNSALAKMTTGDGNTAVGQGSLYEMLSGSYNTAVGQSALKNNQYGIANTALGSQALLYNNGDYNVAAGYSALVNVSSGSSNIGVGTNAGATLTSGSNNIYIGNAGPVSTESGHIYLGDSSVHTATYVAGIWGATAASGVSVYVNSTGQLGTLTSSRRFKKDIEDMADTSEAVLALRPVAFRYKEEIDKTATPQFGLIAEEVEKVDPKLVAHDEKGGIYTVRYEAVNAMMLNEFLKEHHRVLVQQEIITTQKTKIEQVEQRMAEMNRLLQKVADSIE